MTAAPSHRRRRPVRCAGTASVALGLGVVLLGLFGVIAAPPAAASDYRFWSYWYAAPDASAWTYAQIGPAGHRVRDGSVEGWRFVVAAPTPAAPPPRTSAASAFDTICGGVPRPDGKDRVALVVDYGTAADAPPGQRPPSGPRGTCVVVDPGSTGSDVLAHGGYRPRTDGSGLVCGLSGYPAGECGIVVQDPGPPSSGGSGGSSGGGSGGGGSGGASGGTGGGAGGGADPDRGDAAGPGGGTGTGGGGEQPGRGPGGGPSGQPIPSSPSSSGGTGGSPDDPAPQTSAAAAPLLLGTPPPADGSGPGVGLVLGVAAVVGLTVAGVRRRRRPA